MTLKIAHRSDTPPDSTGTRSASLECITWEPCPIPDRPPGRLALMSLAGEVLVEATDKRTGRSVELALSPQQARRILFVLNSIIRHAEDEIASWQRQDNDDKEGA